MTQSNWWASRNKTGKAVSGITKAVALHIADFMDKNIESCNHPATNTWDALADELGVADSAALYKKRTAQRPFTYAEFLSLAAIFDVKIEVLLPATKEQWLQNVVAKLTSKSSEDRSVRAFVAYCLKSYHDRPPQAGNANEFDEKTARSIAASFSTDTETPEMLLEELRALANAMDERAT